MLIWIYIKINILNLSHLKSTNVPSNYKIIYYIIRGIIMKTTQVKELIKALEEHVRNNDKEAIYNMMDKSFREKVELKRYMLLQKYTLNIGTEIKIIKLYNQMHESCMIRTSSKVDGKTVYKNIVLIEEGEELKIKHIL